jgi:hypothetical protein
MRISDDTRFPHPVLSPESDDFGDAAFDVTFTCEESATSGRVALRHQIELREDDIRALVENGTASVGAFVRCRDTYFSSLELLAWPSGEVEFQDGALLNRVAIRPIVWLNDGVQNWKPAGIADEFTEAVTLPASSIIAFGYESILSVGRAKLSPLESIFTLKKSDDAGPDVITIDLHADKITILAGQSAYEVISGLRGQLSTRPAALGAVYLPAVMETLDQLRDGTGAYEERRWLTPFQARCDALAIDLQNPRLVQDAQRLLDQPIPRMRTLAGVEE